MWLIKRWLIQILLLGILLLYIGFGSSFFLCLLTMHKAFLLLSVVYECIYGFSFFFPLSCLITLFVYKFSLFLPSSSSVLLLLCCVWVLFFFCLWCINKKRNKMDKKKETTMEKRKNLFRIYCFIYWCFRKDEQLQFWINNVKYKNNSDENILIIDTCVYVMVLSYGRLEFRSE